MKVAIEGLYVGFRALRALVTVWGLGVLSEIDIDWGALGPGPRSREWGWGNGKEHGSRS